MKWTENENEGHVIRAGQSISATWAMAQGPHLTKRPQEIKGIFVNYALWNENCSHLTNSLKYEMKIAQGSTCQTYIKNKIKIFLKYFKKPHL